MQRESGRPKLTTTFCLASLLVLTLTAVVPASGQLGHTATIVVRVRGDGGQIPEGVRLHLETAEGQIVVGDQPAHTDGEFEFHDVPKRAYRLTARADGYQSVERVVDIAAGANEIVVDFNLPRLAKDAKPNRSALPSLTDGQAPKAARKEYEKAQRAIEAKKFSEARSHLERATGEYPCYARAQTDLGAVLSQERRLKESETALRKSVECDPGFVEAYALLGQFLNAEKRFQDSDEVLDKATRLAPGEWRLYSEKGAAEYGLGQYDRAQQDYLKVRSLNPNPPASLHIDLANVYLKRNAFDKAYTEMQAYLQAEPGGHFAGSARNIMKQMESSGVLSAATPGAATTSSKPQP